MTSTKIIIVKIEKEEGKYCLDSTERQKLLLRIASEITEIAVKFDGCCTYKTKNYKLLNQAQ